MKKITPILALIPLFIGVSANAQSAQDRWEYQQQIRNVQAQCALYGGCESTPETRAQVERIRKDTYKNCSILDGFSCAKGF